MAVRVVPKTKLNLRLTDEMRERCEALVEREGLSLNTLIVRAIDNYLPYRERHWEQEDKRRVRVLRALGKPEPATVPKVGANQRCPCGSGQKYKQCHGQVPVA